MSLGVVVVSSEIFQRFAGLFYGAMFVARIDKKTDGIFL
jgi:hypothetical protein